MSPGLLALVALVASGPVATYAQDPATLAECRALADDLERLACYDRLSGRAPAIADSTQPAAAQPEPPQAAAVTTPTVTAEPRPEASILDESWSLREDSERYPIGKYLSNYILPVYATNNVNDEPFSPVFEAGDIPDQNLDSTEAKFQLSFKARLWTTDDRRWSLWAAYTQQNYWQVYNSDISRPFRETNYMPEAFGTYRLDLPFAGLDWKLLNVGINHQSNGRADPLSRSWDRIFAEVGAERGKLAFMLRVWTRIEESSNDDDNPDITDYYGYSELNAVYRWNGNSLALMGRGNVSTGKGAIQLGWFSRPILGPLRGYVQLFSGYGESMIDYNWNQTTIGIGLALNDGM